MSYQELLTLITGFLGGGLIATVISNWWQWHAAKVASQRRHLEDALRQVYGPAVRLLADCQMLSDLNSDIQKAGHKVFSGRVHESARDQRSEEIKATIESGNTYARKMRENIDEIVRIASAGYHLIDPEDMEVFEDIRRQAVRMEVEFESSLAQQIPFDVKQELGSPSYFRLFGIFHGSVCGLQRGGFEALPCKTKRCINRFWVLDGPGPSARLN